MNMAFSDHVHLLQLTLTAVFLVLLPIASCKVADSFYQQCGDNSTDSNSAVNVDNVLFDLLAKTTLYGFAESTFGSSPSGAAVYALSRCRGDITAAMCSECVVSAAQKMRTTCTHSVEARIWHEKCFLRYDASNFFGLPDTRYTHVWFSGQTAADGDAFDKAARDLMSAVAAKAAADSDRRFGWGKSQLLKGGMSSINDKWTIYGMAQCTPDLHEPACNQCLEVALEKVSIHCKHHMGCNVVSTSCEMRYEMSKFLLIDDDTTTPTAPPVTDGTPTGPPV